MTSDVPLSPVQSGFLTGVSISEFDVEVNDLTGYMQLLAANNAEIAAFSAAKCRWAAGVAQSFVNGMRDGEEIGEEDRRVQEALKARLRSLDADGDVSAILRGDEQWPELASDSAGLGLLLAGAVAAFVVALATMFIAF